MAAIDALAAGAENLDIKALTGRSPWLRFRAGDWRILYRPLMRGETYALAGRAGDSLLIERVVHRSEPAEALRRM